MSLFETPVCGIILFFSAGAEEYWVSYFAH